MKFEASSEDDTVMIILCLSNYESHRNKLYASAGIFCLGKRVASPELYVVSHTVA